MPSLEVLIVLIIPIIMVLSQWSSTMPNAQQDAEAMPAKKQDDIEQEESQYTSKKQNDTTHEVQIGNTSNQVSSKGIFQMVSDAPEELRSIVAQQLSNADTSAMSSVCSSSYQAFWNSEGVWLTLGARDNLSLSRTGVAEFTREAFRRTAYRIDCSELALLAHSPQCGVDANVFKEASHVLGGFVPSDTQEIQLLCKLMRPVLESLNFAAAGAAEAFLRRAHDRTGIVSSQDLEMLDDAYEYALLQHNIMMETIEDHLEELAVQMRNVEQQVCDEHRSLIMDQ